MRNDPRLLDEFRARLSADTRAFARSEGGENGAAITVKGWFGGETRSASFNDQTYTSAGMSSTRDIDRYETRLEPEGWMLENYRKNPVVLLNHMDFGPAGIPIGIGSDRIVADGLFSHSRFLVEETRAAGSTRVAEVWAIHRAGGMPAISVSFVPMEWEEVTEDHEGRKRRIIRFTKQEKLEHSLVTIPGNADALTFSLSRVALSAAKRMGREIPHTDLPGSLGILSQAAQLAASSDDLVRSLAGSPGGDPVILARVAQIRRRYLQPRPSPQPKAAASNDVATTADRLRAIGVDIRATA